MTAIEQALHASTGVQASVLLLAAADVAAIAAANPLRDISTDPSRAFVTFLSRPVDPSLVPAVDAEALAPEVMVVAERAIYQWCPDGSLATKVPPAWWKRLDQVVTTRNLRTVERLVEVGGADGVRARMSLSVRASGGAGWTTRVEASGVPSPRDRGR